MAFTSTRSICKSSCPAADDYEPCDHIDSVRHALAVTVAGIEATAAGIEANPDDGDISGLMALHREAAELRALLKRERCARSTQVRDLIV